MEEVPITPERYIAAIYEAITGTPCAAQGLVTRKGSPVGIYLASRLDTANFYRVVLKRWGSEEW